MSLHYYHICQKYRGRLVEINTVDGQVHRGVIQNVTDREVYIQPVGGYTGSRFGGFSYGWGYPGWGFGRGFAVGIGLGAITSLALLPWFWI
ncbi:hypothetical protein [Halalkalibacter urbisdiaboli]|uniref:hypothetical protein n=1 Tax=Halalkalibacter urbisdiaboli TaxID=1960589 RepID=UPI000B4518FB|nr:hypothetical protein [Halalkalibacter urbisdiaboli]